MMRLFLYVETFPVVRKLRFRTVQHYDAETGPCFAPVWLSGSFAGFIRTSKLSRPCRHNLSAHELYYYGARYYNPNIGRFLTADWVVPDPFSAQSLNRYSYVGNNPINFIDPTGNKVEVYFVDDAGNRLGDGGGSGNSISAPSGGRNSVEPILGRVVIPDPNAGITAAINSATPALGGFNPIFSDFQRSTVAQVISTGVDFLPFIGTAKSVVELFTGQDPFTGNRVNRAVSAVGLAASLVGAKGVFKGISEAGSSLSFVRRLSNNRGFARIGDESVESFASFEQARNRALDVLGKVDPKTRKPYFGRLSTSAGKDNVVGFTSRTDGLFKRYRLDYDPVKGTHINVDVGKGAARIKKAFTFPGSEESFIKLLERFN